MTVRLSSADSTLDPLALAPGRFGTDTVYSPPDSSTLTPFNGKCSQDLSRAGRSPIHR